MARLSSYFERVVIISLPQRDDRRERIRDHLEERDLATPQDFIWSDGIDGYRQRVPDWWKPGPGAWGCRASQLQVLEQAHRDRLTNVLILEDDAHFHHHTRDWLSELMPHLPDDWDFFFLGGQHLKSPHPTHHPRLVRGRAINRTHAYAVNSHALEEIIARVKDETEYQAHPGWHIDHQFSHYQQQGLWKAYAPAWWFAAQDSGQSNITCQEDPRRWWQPGHHYWKLPFISSADPADPCEWIHYCQEEPPARSMERASWLRNIARQAWQEGRLPACSLSPTEITQSWPAGFRTPASAQELAQLADYPANGLFSHSFNHKPSLP